MSALLPAAVAFSVVMIFMLWRADPKRLRIAGEASRGGSQHQRRTLAAASLVPGVVIALTGDSAAFLIWFGGCALAGWLAAQLPARFLSRPPELFEKNSD